MKLVEITDEFLEEMGCYLLGSPRRAWIYSMNTYARGAQYALVEDGQIQEIFENKEEYDHWKNELP